MRLHKDSSFPLHRYNYVMLHMLYSLQIKLTKMIEASPVETANKKIHTVAACRFSSLNFTNTLVQMSTESTDKYYQPAYTKFQSASQHRTSFQSYLSQVEQATMERVVQRF